MAEAFLDHWAGGRFEVESAGFEPTEVNPLVVTVMREEGLDLSGKGTQSVFELYKAGKLYDHVITVCDDTREKECPLFPGITHRLHWPFADPAALTGSQEEKLIELRKIRDQIKSKLSQWLQEQGQGQGGV
jgi:arsenate reductase